MIKTDGVPSEIGSRPSRTKPASSSCPGQTSGLSVSLEMEFQNGTPRLNGFPSEQDTHQRLTTVDKARRDKMLQATSRMGLNVRERESGNRIARENAGKLVDEDR